MTDNTKMREAFEKWAESKGYRTDTYTEVPDDYWDDTTQSAWRAWQAAQSVPVVGEPVAWRWSESDGSRFFDWRGDNWDHHDKALKEGFVIQYAYPAPTHSIPATEFERLRKDAESYRRLVAAAKAEADTHCTYPDCICPDGVSSGSCNLGLPDAAIAADKK